VAWIACCQQVELVRLKHEIHPALARAAAPAAPVQPGRMATTPPQRAIDRLKTLLIEREQAVADARDAAADLGIPSRGAEMRAAVALATADLDRSIAQLIGPEAAARLAAADAPEPDPISAPMAPAPVVVNLPPPQVVVNVALPPPAPITLISAQAAMAEDSAGANESPVPDQPVYAASPVLYGGGLGGFVASRPARERKPTQAQALKYFAASAGIPLQASPLAAVATTSPLLLARGRLR
jgi:hypothetical protein